MTEQHFCDFCDCECCRTGKDWKLLGISHAPARDGRWICDVCFTYDLCTSGPDRNSDGPCDDKRCRHRPEIVGPWEELD